MSTEHVLITGTTSGVGRALLELYVRHDAKVISLNRRRDLELEALYPSVRFECLDVRSASEVEGLIQRLGQANELPDVFIMNAGINEMDNDESFDLARFRAVIETNLFGVLNFVAPLMQLPPGRVPRHLVAISSMANYVGNPYGLGYTTSKRAVTSCFDAWQRMYAGTDLVFQLVMLGPVRTAIFTMEERLPAWMVWVKSVFTVSLAGTARAIRRFAATRRRRLFHPFRAVPLYFAVRLCQLLVPSFFRGRKTLAGRARRTEASVRARDA